MYSLTNILNTMISNGNNKAKLLMEHIDNERSEITSIRLKPDTQATLREVSQSLGISFSSVINTIIDSVISQEVAPLKHLADSIYDRLLFSFEIHGLTLQDMSCILKDYGVKSKTLKSKDMILDLVTPELLTNISQLFGINRTWLEGVGNEIYIPESLSAHEVVESKIDSIFKRGIPGQCLVIYNLNDEDNDTGPLNDIFIMKYNETCHGINFSKYEVCRLKVNMDHFRLMQERNPRVTLNHFPLNMPLRERIGKGHVFPSFLGM